MQFVVRAEGQTVATLTVTPVGPVKTAAVTLATRSGFAAPVTSYEAFEYLNLAMRDTGTSVEAYRVGGWQPVARL